ncbi:MAG: hypothetical protein D6734_05740 [Candidatus Schekmanbacteria bacterium]|nr:MAG: hypothetical protein D6734_05740 [Candidatus Schekmanbacteria bacterium]
MKKRITLLLRSKRKIFIPISIILLILLTFDSCSIKNMLKRCSFKFKSIKIEGMELGKNKIHGEVTLEVDNPNWIPVKVKSVKCGLFIGKDKFFKGKTTEEFKIPAGEKREITVPFKATYKQITLEMIKILTAGAGGMKISGVAFIDAFFITIPVEFEVLKKD